MVIYIKVATFNIQNRYMQDEFIDDIKYLNTLNKFILDEKIDILGLQEVVSKIKNGLSTSHKIYGESRLSSLLDFSKYNEYNPVITDYEVVSNKTYHLPFIGSKIPRIATVLTINSDEVLLRVINTHLCLYKYHEVKKKELDKLIDIVKTSELPTIIMGDFNLRENAEDLKYFQDKLAPLGIKMVENIKKTFGRKILDYIFVSDCFNIKNINTVKTDLSDHNALIVDLSLK